MFQKITEIIFMLCVPVWMFGQVYNVTTIQNNGPDANRINVVMLAEGYQAGQMGNYITDAGDINDELFDYTPFKEYVNFFNTYAIESISTQSGSDHPGTATDVTEPAHPVGSFNTHFNSTFDYFNIHRLLVATNSSSYYSVLNDNFPAYDQVVMLCNSPYYGGSGGAIATTSLDAAAPKIAIHELGHSFASLSDEYYAGDFYANETANMTQETDPALVKWDEWYGTNGVGIYQHCCGGQSSTWYRPHQACMMRSLNNTFCSVCTQKIVDEIYDLVTPIENEMPPSNVMVNITGSQLFQADFIYPVPNTLTIEWILNGNVISTNTNSVLLDNSNLVNGFNNLVLMVTDDTDLSRSYLPADGYEFSKTWPIMFDQDCPTDILHDTPINSGAYQASNAITSEVQMPANGNVSYRAATELNLKKNFEVLAGTVFEAMIGNCN